MMAGQDTVAQFQRALKETTNSKPVNESKAEDIEVYLFGTTTANYTEHTPLKPEDHLPKGSNSSDRYFFVHLPGNQNLKGTPKTLLSGATKRRGRPGGGISLPGNRCRSGSPSRGGRAARPGGRKPMRKNKSLPMDATREQLTAEEKKKKIAEFSERAKKDKDAKAKRDAKMEEMAKAQKGEDALEPKAKRDAEAEQRRKEKAEAKEAKAKKDAEDERKRREEADAKKRQEEADQQNLQCYYKRGEKSAGTSPESICMKRGQTIESLKEKIMASNPSMKDIKIYTQSGKELSNNDLIPDTTSSQNPLIIKKQQQCFYKLGNSTGNPDATTFMEGDSIKSLKDQILKSSSLPGVNTAQNFQIFLPSGRELADNDSIPDTTSSSNPLIIKKRQQCFYKMGDAKTEAISSMEGDTIQSLKEKIMVSNGLKDTKDLKIYLPGPSGKELRDTDVIPDTTSLQKPLVVKQTQQCFYKIGNKGRKTDTATFMEGDSVKFLKDEILASQGQIMKGIKDTKGIKIYMPGANGKPGMELSDKDSIPNSSTLNRPLIIQTTQQCFYKVGTNGAKTDTATYMEGDSVQSLKDKILTGQGSSLNGVKDTKDLKIFLPGRDGQPVKELTGKDIIPDTSTIQKPLIIKSAQQCFYKIGADKTDATSFLEGDSVKSLKDKILASKGSKMYGLKNAGDLKIYLPGRNGQPGKELNDNDIIPSSSTLGAPLIVKSTQQCFYKMGNKDTRANSTAFLEGDSVKTLKEKILASQGSSLNGVKDKKDIKIFLSDSNGQPGKELSDGDNIPSTSTLKKPLIVKSMQQCFYQMGKDGKANEAPFMEGDSVKSLKAKIMAQTGGVKDIKDLKIFLPGKNGQPGKELSDDDLIPDTSSLEKPLVVLRPQQGFYKLGNKDKPDATSFMAGDSVKSLKNNILEAHRGSSDLNGAKETKDLHVFLPGPNGQLGKKLNDGDIISDSSSFDEPWIVRAGVPVSTSNVFMAFTLPMSKKEPKKSDCDALAISTGKFHCTHLKKHFDSFQGVDVSVGRTLFGQNKPNANYHLYLEWDITVWFNSSGAVPDQTELCKALVKIDMMNYLMNYVRSLEGTDFTGVTGMFTEQINS